MDGAQMNQDPKHYQWIFSGAGVMVIGGIASWILNRKNNTKNENRKEQSQTNTQIVNVNFSGDDSANGHKTIEDVQDRIAKREDELRRMTQILFVDDDITFKVVKIFRNSGWNSVKIVKDIKNLHSQEVSATDIFFIDIHGVGKDLGFRDEGLGLAIALKDEYQDKKVVIYSSDRTGDRFHEALRRADETLSKDAEPYEFMRIAMSLAETKYGNK